MTTTERMRLVDLYIKWRREDVTPPLLPKYDIIATRLREQYVAEDITEDLVMDTLDNVAYELVDLRFSQWIDNLMKMMGVE